jgi:hypothetical protein
MKINAYIVPSILGAFFSFMGMAAAMTGGTQVSNLYAGLLMVAYVITITYVVYMDSKGKGADAAHWLAWPMVMVYVVTAIAHFAGVLN